MIHDAESSAIVAVPREVAVVLGKTGSVANEKNDGPTMSSLTELQELIQKKYGLEGDAIDPDKPMLELGLDSLAIAEFLFEVEDHFEIRLKDDDPDIDTLRKLSVLVDNTVAAKEASTT